MQRHQQILSVAVALAVWASAPGTAIAAPPDPDGEIAEAPAPATWLVVAARNQATGTSGPVAVLFGVARERGRDRTASLRVDCFDGLTSVHLDADGLGVGPFAVEVRYSLDGRRFVPDSWAPSADRSGLVLTGDRAIRVPGRAVWQGRAASGRRAALVGAVPAHLRGRRHRAKPAPDGRAMPVVRRAGDQRRRPLASSLRASAGRCRRLRRRRGHEHQYFCL